MIRIFIYREKNCLKQFLKVKKSEAGIFPLERASVLMYHNIATPPAGAKMRGLYVTPRMFRFQMWYLKRAGFRVVPLKEIVDIAKAGGKDKKQKNLVSLTFDDGYLDFFENAFPVLKKYGYPATVFVVPGLAGRHNLWDSDCLGAKKDLMDWEKIRYLNNNGITIGAHTQTHPRLSSLSPEDIKMEVFGSKAQIEEQTGRPADFFCYPYGDFNDVAVRVVKEAGFHGALSVERGFVSMGDDPFTLKRIPVWLNTWPLSFIYKLHSDYEARKGRPAGKE